MNVILIDYRGDKTKHEIGSEDEIKTATIEIRSGDEVLFVLYENGELKNFDSSQNRIWDFDDGCYVVFSKDKGINLFKNEKWLNRESSISFEWEEDE